MTVWLGIVTTIVAIAGSVIAYFQFVTARRKLMLDLFDRRLKVVEGVERAVGPFLANGKLTLDNFNDLLTAKAAARFLFDQDVLDHLNLVHRDFAFWLAHSDKSLADPDTPNREALVDKKYEVEMRLTDYPKNSAAIFGPYMRFTDKQTKPWLPLVKASVSERLKIGNSMTTDRFPYEVSRWGSNQPEQAKRWFEELEMLGPQNVRARLAQTDASSAGAIAIGSIPYLTIGFAQEWLAWHDRKREALEAQRHNRQVFWTRFAALAATVAATSAAIGWAWTIFHR